MRATVVVASIAVLATGACRHEPAEREPPPVRVRCAAPAREPIEETIPLRGRVEPPPGGDLAVASQVAGRVIAIAVREGQRIASGEVVATVDDTASRGALRQADAAVAQAHAAEVNAKTTLTRTRELVDRGIAARQELEDAIARDEAARAGVVAAQAASEVARRTLGRVLVRSSFDGVVTRIWRGEGALVDGTAATPIAQLAASRAVEFVADATSRELALVVEGQRAQGTLALAGQPFAGVVRAKATALDPATGLGTVRVTLEPLAEPPAIGTFGRITIVTARREGVLVLPSAALRGAIADGAEVVVCKDGKAEVRPVEVGFRDRERFEVAGGLAPGERVALDHVLGLHDGTAIDEGP
jgi:membrane fusion protein (multidrug efflux system)